MMAKMLDGMKLADHSPDHSPAPQEGNGSSPLNRGQHNEASSSRHQLSRGSANRERQEEDDQPTDKVGQTSGSSGGSGRRGDDGDDPNDGDYHPSEDEDATDDEEGAEEEEEEEAAEGGEGATNDADEDEGADADAEGEDEDAEVEDEDEDSQEEDEEDMELVASVYEATESHTPSTPQSGRLQQGVAPISPAQTWRELTNDVDQIFTDI